MFETIVIAPQTQGSDQQWKPTASIAALRERARITAQIRNWFFSQGVLEVETPLLSAAANTEPYIESFAVTDGLATRYLRTSAEFHLKRMLCAGYGDVYELGKVFRVDECGQLHNPEFTMLEWYRRGYDHHRLIDESEALLRDLCGSESFPGMSRTDYRTLLKDRCDIDVASTTVDNLLAVLSQHDIDVPEAIRNDFDSLLDLLMGTVVADALTADTYHCIYDYPASQASLARIDNTNRAWPVASRFEIYYGPVELANGFHELADPTEQLQRFNTENEARARNRQQQMPLDHSLINALSHGLPDCAGVAFGLDRLLMALMPEVTALEQVNSFNWERA